MKQEQSKKVRENRQYDPLTLIIKKRQQGFQGWWALKQVISKLQPLLSNIQKKTHLGLL
jgi:hypothetical protein